MPMLLALGSYLLFAIAMTAWVARCHQRFGPAFMRVLFERNSRLGDAANRLVVLGMNLFALAAGALLVENASVAVSSTGLVEMIADKCGAFLLILALIHFVRFWNLIQLAGRKKMVPPPLPAWLSDSSALSSAAGTSPGKV